ncbi:hypothetical protein FPY71_15745 [Aureimonas fodinaquatilis]|uniref:N-acetyltransferase domain-containing protein n=1 Tax=Aureimonas fodinaquatilis TaxID=2565783 RepID=A0A5B0DQE2_9HYPH|nr:GNAT family N-acetyltransferase [Aureimonas fodinaquatilis]KAA0969004.1 hypothetical protein FPY71_15745 [Aureimonas fodinaquatilis]
MTEAFVRPAGGSDIDPVVELLHANMNMRISRETWRRILDYPWRPSEAERGWLVEDAGAIVGFMATIYSERPTASGMRRFCDLGAWYLLRPYRGTGIGDSLLQAGMAVPGVTYATMTARAATGRRIRALGFEILDNSRQIFSPAGASDSAKLEMLNPAQVDWTAQNHQILQDHAGLGLHVAAFAATGRPPVLFLFQRKLKGADIAYHEMVHCSDLEFLAANAQAVANCIVVENNAVLAIDSRFLPANGTGEVEKLPLARWFRAAEGVKASEVDHLYSETLLLDMKLP